jgi:sulfatase maturation enzyme AslB (radical SAM superfamily)
MKILNTRCVILLGSLLALVSCTDDKNPAQQYGNTMAQSYKSARKLDNKVNVQQVQKSIQEFYAANGRYPADLNEVSAFNGITLKSDNYDYNPVTGSITEKQ